MSLGFCKPRSYRRAIIVPMSGIMKRFCLTCSAPLMGRPHAKFCSSACRVLAHRSRGRDTHSRRCRCCALPLPADQRVGTIFCGDTCRKAFSRGGNVPVRRAHQARRHGTGTLDGYVVRQVGNDVAKAFVLAHEWLGTMPAIPLACYGLFNAEGELAGIAVFGLGSQPMWAEFGRDAVALARGAVRSGEPKNSGSFLISRAVRQAHRTFGWKVFVGWADVRAGESGAIYRASGWSEKPNIGGDTRTEYRRPDGTPVSERAARRFATGLGLTVTDLVASGWRREIVPRKRRFVRVVG